MTPSAKMLEKTAAKPLSLREIIQPVIPQLALVEEKLKSVGQESEGVLKESSHYVLDGGGKRLRASLVLFCASIHSKNHSDDAVDLAAAVELIHSATLVHDDIVDRAVLRRLKPTINVEYGEDVAVLLGDFLYAKAFEIIARIGDEKITASMAITTHKMCEGEIDQLKHRYRADLSLDEYLSFIEKKTATLIASSAYCGARLAALSTAEQEALGSFGLNIGIAYQIIDDLLDVIGSEDRLGKTLRTDAGNGKMTLPMILLLRTVSGTEKEKLLSNLQSAHPDWKLIQPLIEKYKIVEKTERFADDYFQRAIDPLKSFPVSVKKTLEDLSRFILHRDY